MRVCHSRFNIFLFYCSLGGYENKSHVDLLLSLHIYLGSEQAIVNNLSTAVSFILAKDYEVRNSTIPFVLHTCRKFPHLFKERNFIEPLENQFKLWLLNASRIAAKPSQSMNNLFNLKLSSKSTPVTELDGTPCKDIFTVSNETPFYSEDQIFNHITFSLLHSWIKHIYIDTEDSTTLDSSFKDAVLKYCLRVIEQSQLKPIGSNEYIARRLPDMSLIESIRILNLVCQKDSSVVKQCFSIIKKLFSLTRPGWNSRSNGFLFLEIMEFFLRYGDKTLFDVDPVFRQYFDSYLIQNFVDPIISFETVWFCLRFKEEILVNSNIFSQHFHSLLRIAAWHSFEFKEEFKQLIPTFIGPSTYLEIFHAILDLPLLSAALERMEPDTPNKDSRPGLSMSSSGGYHLLFNLILRKESGVIINFWDSSNTLNMLKSFLNDVYLTPRIRNICKNVPDYLEMYFEVILNYSDNQSIEQLLPAMFERIDQLFPFKPYEIAVRKLLVNKILACFERCPHLIVTYQKLIIDFLGDTAAVGREELVLHLVWAIGEYTSDHFSDIDAPKLFSDYDEALELFAFERMNIASMETQGQKNRDFTTKSQIYNTRLMLITVSTLTKLASKWQPLATRVRLCLEKVIRYSDYFHTSVTQNTKHCLNILKYPSIASSIMGSSDEELEKNLILPSQIQIQTELIASPFQQKSLHQFVL